MTNSSANLKENEVKKKLEIPVSNLLSIKCKAALELQESVLREFEQRFVSSVAEKSDDPLASPERREAALNVFSGSRLEGELMSRYKVNIMPVIRNGVKTLEFTPKNGVMENNKSRVLINLHGMLFNVDSRMDAILESVPVASVGEIKVVSIDYRVAPEHFFPAASKDVEAVYQDLLNTYKPENIGFYGCSAPSLAAQSIAWFIKVAMPIPGAIAMLGGAGGPLDGDSVYIAEAIDGKEHFSIFKKYLMGPDGYFKDVDMNNPLIWPLEFDNVAGQFPPSLFLSGTRDPLLSTKASAHQKLVRLNVPTEFHIWEGQGIDFIQLSVTPAAWEAHDVLIKFFDKHLGA